MNQFKQIFDRLSWSQRIWIAVAVVAVIGGLTYVNHWNDERDFKPLFSGLADEDAGALVAKLHEAGVEYRLANNGSTILVPSDKVAEARLQMASAGLPKSGRIGFELFDKANFGASEFTEQVNYHRAIEGELERSVMSIREVETARVHLTLAKDSLYSEARQPAKASVLVKLRHAAALSPQNIAAICQLTASAVPGLSADQVSLVDTNGNLLNRPRPNATGDDAGGSEAALDYRKAIEQTLQNKIAATLEPLLGPDHFRIGVSADVDLTSGEQSEEDFDPAKSVMVSSQTTRRWSRAGQRLRRSGNGVESAASHVEAVHRRQQLFAPYRKHQLSDQPAGEAHAPAAGRGEEVIAVRSGGSFTALGRRQENRRSSLRRETESDSRPGRGRHWPRSGARRSTGGGRVSLRIDAERRAHDRGQRRADGRRQPAAAVASETDGAEELQADRRRRRGRHAGAGRRIPDGRR